MNLPCMSFTSISRAWISMLPVVNLLQLGDDELAVHVVHLHLQGVDFHVIFLDLVFHVESVGEGGDGELVVLLDKSFQGSLVHTGHVLDIPYLLFDNIGNTHDEKDSISCRSESSNIS